jgi:clan AA aspartic protease
MGAVMTKLVLANQTDLDNARAGLLPAEQVRRTEVSALVDTGASTLALPADVCDVLGLIAFERTQVRLADGSTVDATWVGSLRLEILGRQMICDALRLPAGTTPLVGQIPLERLDLVVEPKTRDLRANPAHPEGPLLDLLAVG